MLIIYSKAEKALAAESMDDDLPRPWRHHPDRFTGTCCFSTVPFDLMVAGRGMVNNSRQNTHARLFICLPGMICLVLFKMPETGRFSSLAVILGPLPAAGVA